MKWDTNMPSCGVPGRQVVPLQGTVLRLTVTRPHLLLMPAHWESTKGLVHWAGQDLQDVHTAQKTISWQPRHYHVHISAGWNVAAAGDPGTPCHSAVVTGSAQREALRGGVWIKNTLL